MTINLSDGGTEQGTGRRGTTALPDWDLVSGALGARVTCAWKRAEYGMYRADNGAGAVPAGVTIPRTGTAWATVCHHGTIRGAHKGNGAEQAGKARTQWCTKCAAGAAGTLPVVGHAPTGPSTTTTTGPVTTATQAGPATPAAPSKAVTTTKK